MNAISLWRICAFALVLLCLTDSALGRRHRRRYHASDEIEDDGRYYAESYGRLARNEEPPADNTTQAGRGFLGSKLIGALGGLKKAYEGFKSDPEGGEALMGSLKEGASKLAGKMGAMRQKLKEKWAKRREERKKKRKERKGGKGKTDEKEEEKKDEAEEQKLEKEEEKALEKEVEKEATTEAPAHEGHETTEAPAHEEHETTEAPAA